MRIRMLIMSVVFISIGMLGLTLIVVFKDKVNKFYDGYETLSESQKNYYKNIMIFIPFIIFIAFGLYSLTCELTGFSMSKYLLNRNMNIYQIGGILAVLYGFFTLVVRFTKLKYSLFSKLRTFEKKYGYKKGNIIHAISYTIAPIIFGVFLFLGLIA